LLSIQTDIGCLQTTSVDGDGLDSLVPKVPFAARGSINYVAGSTCHGGQMSQLTLPVSHCQQSPDSSSSATRGVSRSHSAPQLGKRKGSIDWCNYKGDVQTCQLHKAQANFRKSLRRGFLSPLAAQGSGEKHVGPCEARGDHPASSQVTPCTILGPLLVPENVALTLSISIVFTVLSSMGCDMHLTPTIAHKLQAEDVRQTSDLELQASQLQAE